MTSGHLVRVNVRRLEQVQSGSRAGREWTKYVVHGDLISASGEILPTDGLPWATFDKLELGEQDVLMQAYTRRGAEKPESYTLKQPTNGKPKKPASDNARFDQLEADMRHFSEKMQRMAARIKALEDLYEQLPSDTRRTDNERR